MNIAVYCASANHIDEKYFKAAEDLGIEIGRRKGRLIYGGTRVGLMKQVADAVKSHGGKVTGIIPECIYNRGVAVNDIDELVITPDMTSRKSKLQSYADAFIALPGGWGTLEEIIEMISSKQLKYHHKPIVFLNINGFYDTFFTFIQTIKAEGFISSAYDGVYYVANDVKSAIDYIDSYKTAIIVDKY